MKPHEVGVGTVVRGPSQTSASSGRMPRETPYCRNIEGADAPTPSAGPTLMAPSGRAPRGRPPSGGQPR